MNFPAEWAMLQDGVRFRNTVTLINPRERANRVHLGIFSGRLGFPEVALQDLVFFDLETTGLSGGSGTVAFLAAFGSFSNDGSMSVRQYFMDDYPSETDFLQNLAGEFAKATAVITYNGSSFDMPLYAVRRTMNGLGPPTPGIHIDALHAARKLWRRTIGDCSLGNLETEVLGVVREGDIPGSEVPEVWFEYLKCGKTDRLSQVFLHNELDVRSLADLFLLIHDATMNSVATCKSDPVGLAELQARIDESLAERTLCAALNSGNTRATRLLMKLYARQSRHENRIALIPRLPDDPAGLFAKSVYTERILGNVKEAIHLAKRAEVDAKGVLRERIRRRILRLMKKLAKAQ
jgi:uncharacterized protein YprB with RNaseH-like and TPR domain